MLRDVGLRQSALGSITSDRIENTHDERAGVALAHEVKWSFGETREDTDKVRQEGQLAVNVLEWTEQNSREVNSVDARSLPPPGLHWQLHSRRRVGNVSQAMQSG